MILVGYEFRLFKIGIMKFRYIVYHNGFISCFKKNKKYMHNQKTVV